MNTETDTMLEAVSQIIKSNFGGCAGEIKKFENVTNNFVYSFTVSDKHYILKLFRLYDGLKETVTETRLRKMKERLLGTMRDFEDLPSVLCHGDLSKKNIIMQYNGEILLIDRDDAMALNWMADISRLTFRIKLNYSGQESELFRSRFLEHYNTAYRKSEFDTFESAFHIYSALDSLLFFKSVGDKEIEIRLKRCLDGLELQ